MYIDNSKNIIQDNEPFKSSQGVKYPSNFPKNVISELHKVNETVCKCPDGHRVKGFAVDENYNQVWEYEQKSVDEINQEIASQWENIRSERNNLLSSCDWTVLPDAPISNKQEWIDYRQLLRDITKQSDPFNIIFPAPPQ